MIKLKHIGIGVLILGVISGAVLVLQSQNKSYAANTIFASNEIITIGGTTDGMPPVGWDGGGILSKDSNVVMFSSAASNLPNPTTYTGLYAYNIKTNTLVRVDVSTSGVVGNGPIIGGRAISETGRYITFATSASNLIDGTTTAPGQMNILMRDLQTGTTTSLRSDYNHNSSHKSEKHLGVSNDGRFILWASRYVSGTYPYPYSIMYGDTKTVPVSWTKFATGTDTDTTTNPWNIDGQISCDGSFAVYQHSGLIQLADTRNGTVSKVSLTGYTSQNPVISCSGRYILYATKNRTDITPTPSGMNADFHLVRYDRITGERMYIDSNSSGVFSTPPVVFNMPSYSFFVSSVSDTGDVVFKYNGNMYLKHLSDGSGTLEPIAKDTSGATVSVDNGVISADGRYITFRADPYALGLASSPAGTQLIRVKTGL